MKIIYCAMDETNDMCEKFSGRGAKEKAIAYAKQYAKKGFVTRDCFGTKDCSNTYEIVWSYDGKFTNDVFTI